MRSLLSQTLPRRIATFYIFALAFAAPALASEGEGVIGSPMGWAFRWINFAIVAGLLGYVVAKLGRPAFRRRAESISEAIEQSAAAKTEAETKLREAEGMLARLEQEVAGLREAAMRDAAAERERIRATAREEAAKIERAAQAEIAAAERAARMELKALAARLAVERAEVDIRMRITPQAEEMLFRTFVGNLARSVN